MPKNLPIVALVGQPNAGKSSLLNKIAKKPLAVTSDLAGTTRDRQYIDTAWAGVAFTLVDTAGLSAVGAATGRPLQELENNIMQQIEIALDQADAIIFVVDGKEIRGAIAQATAQKFRKIKKPVLLCVNKLDSPKQRDVKLEEFKSLGLKPMFGVSAITGAGIGDMLDAVVGSIRDISRGASSEQANSQAEDAPRASIAVSIVGKPNVGKSSIFNKILNQDRVVVSPIPGTTRTAIDENISIGGINYTFIDTAGLKKKEFRQAQPDIFSGFQTFKSIRKSDVCFFVLDAAAEITKQDQRVASEIVSMDKGCVILANKSDLLRSSPPKAGGVSAASGGRRGGKNGQKQFIGKPADNQYQSIRDYISHHFPFLWMCPLIFVSAMTGEGIAEAISSIKPIYDRRNKKIADEQLKDFLYKILKTNPPKLLRDQKKPKVFSLHQLDVNPPHFELVVNHAGAISQQFRKSLENAIIRQLDFFGTPIILKLRGKDKT